MARAAARPQVSWQKTPATSAILLITVLVHVAGVLSPELRVTLLEHGAQHPVVVESGQWYRLVTSAFLHSDDGAGVVSHIGLNMFWLWIIGSQLEPRTGSVSFATLYLGAAVGGSAVAHAAGVGGIGASGAIFGLLGFWLPGAVRERATPRGKGNLLAWVWLSAFMLTAPFWPGGGREEIGWQAHIGGWVTGFAIAAAWLALASRRRQIVRAAVAAGVATIPVLALVAGAGGIAPSVPPAVPVAWADDSHYSKQARAQSLRSGLGDQAVVTEARPDPSGPDQFTVDPRAFGVMEDSDVTDVEYLDGIEVLTSRTRRAQLALRRAGHRWLAIDESGKEWELAALDAAMGEPDFAAWTVPDVADVTVARGAVRTHVDFEGEPPPIAMQVRFLQVLVEELRRAGVADAHIAPDIGAHARALRS